MSKLGLMKVLCVIRLSNVADFAPKSCQLLIAARTVHIEPDDLHGLEDLCSMCLVLH